MHIAASLGVPLVAIRGADERMWDPVGEEIIIQMKRTSAKACYDITSPDAPAYMNTFREITPNEVIDKVKTVMELPK